MSLSTKLRDSSLSLRDAHQQTTMDPARIVCISHATTTERRTTSFFGATGSLSPRVAQWGLGRVHICRASVLRSRNESRICILQASPSAAMAKDYLLIGTTWKLIPAD